LKEKGLNCTTPAEMEIIRDIKETMCFVASDFEDATKEASKSSCYDKTYDLPDGRKLTLGAERFRCPEALFEPMQAGIELEGI
jgi:actin-related protein